jgi:hypothetical protein
MVVAVFYKSADAADVIRELQELGWTGDRLGAVYREPDEMPAQLSTEHTRGEAKMLRGALIGGGAGLALGAAALALPAVGPLVVLGALELGLLGAVKGGLIGSFIGLGIPEQDAAEYQEAIRTGGFFVEASADDDAEAERVAEIFRAHDPRALHIYQPRRARR